MLIKKLIIIPLFFFCFLLTADSANATINFDQNGKWETTFDSDEMFQFNGILPDNMQWGGNWAMTKVTGVLIEKAGLGYRVGDAIFFHAYLQGRQCDLMVTEIDGNGGIVSVDIAHPGFGNTAKVDAVFPVEGGSGSGAEIRVVSIEEKLTHVTDSANNPLGNGRGVRYWIGDGSNVGSGTISVVFPVPEKEIWIRWYMRYQEGFSWEYLIYDKHLYIRTGGNREVIPIFYGLNNYSLASQGTSNAHPVTSGNFGWNQIMSGSSGDGIFHCYEIQIKMDNDGTDGIGRLWIDGVLRAENKSVDWSYQNLDARKGWTWFGFNSNQSSPTGGPYYVDYDDMTIYNQTPPNVDENGNAFIGPIGWGVESIPGDLNSDGTVNIFDYNIFLQNFGATDCGNVADLNNDCSVNIFDYNILLENFGTTGQS